MAPPTKLPRSVSLAEFDRIKRRLGFAFLALLGVTTLGTIGFYIIAAGEHSLVDALYMTVITLSTVGFAEIIDVSGRPAARLFTVVLLLGGMGVVAYSVPLMAAFAIEGHLFNVFARRRKQKAISKLANHYIVWTPCQVPCSSPYAGRTGKDSSSSRTPRSR